MSTTAARYVRNSEWWVVAGLLLLVVLIRLPGLEQPFDNDSAAIAYHARSITQGEPLYGSHHPGHHMPGAYYTYALAFKLLGDRVLAVKLLLIPWTWLTAWLVYRLGLLLFGRATGLAAAVFFTLLTSHQRLMGLTGEIELFANLPRVAGVLLVALLVRKSSRPWTFVFVGALGGVAMLFKAVYVSPLAVGAAVAVVAYWRGRRGAGALRILALRLGWLGAGFVAVVSVVLAYFAAEGLISRLLLVLTLGREYMAVRTEGTSVLAMLTTPLLGLRKVNILLLLLSFAGFFQILRDWLRVRDPQRLAYILPLWYVVSFAEAGATRTNFPHYYLLVLPPLALLAAPPFLAICGWIRRRLAGRSRWIRDTLLVLLVLLVLLAGYRRNLVLYKYYLRYKAGLRTYEEYLVKGWFLGEQLIRVQKVADYVKLHTEPEDRIYYWSGDMQLYYLADRRCAADFIWPISTESMNLQGKILSPGTKYIVLGDNKYLARPRWLIDGVAADYVLETVIDEQEIYRRKD